MSAVRQDMRPLIEELARAKALPPTAVADLEATIGSSPYLANVLSSAIENGSFKHLVISSDPHEAGRYDSRTGTIYLDISNFVAKNFDNEGVRQDNLSVVLGHETGHALVADAERRERYLLSYEATDVVREASRNGTSADLTAPADRYLTFMRRNEAFAELVGMNSLASRTTGGRDDAFDRAEFLNRVGPSTPCVDNGVLAKGVQISPEGFQSTGGKLNSPAVEAVARCYTDQANRLGIHGDTGYKAYYGAYVMETLAKARNDYAKGTTMHVPDIELNMAALKLDPRRIERAGLDLGGHGKSFSYVDISVGKRDSEIVTHTYSRSVAPGTRKASVEAELDAPAHRPLRIDLSSHPEHKAFEAIRQTVRGGGRWNDDEVDNISAALLREHVDDPLSKRLDNVVIGKETAQGRTNVFAVYSPFGDQGPHFTTQVDANAAAKEPAQQNLQQVEQRRQQQGVDQVQQQPLQQSPPQHRGPHMSL